MAWPGQEGSHFLWNKLEQKFEAWQRASAQAGEAAFGISEGVVLDEAGL